MSHLQKREHLPPAKSSASYIELLTLPSIIVAKATRRAGDKAAGEEIKGQAVTLFGEENSTNQKPAMFCFWCSTAEHTSKLGLSEGLKVSDSAILRG